MIEKLPKKLLAVGVMSVLGLTACESYQLEDNEFRVTGSVDKVGERSINLEIKEIELAEGEASEVFELGAIVQIHDNCKDCGDGFFGSRETTGSLFDYRENLADLGILDIGSCVEIQGHMREYTSDDKTTHRPEYGIAQVVSC
jgi:hypothetical protein